MKFEQFFVGFTLSLDELSSALMDLSSEGGTSAAASFIIGVSTTTVGPNPDSRTGSLIILACMTIEKPSSICFCSMCWSYTLSRSLKEDILDNEGGESK